MRILLTAVAAVVAAFVALTLRWFVWPTQGEPREADAVVVLSGGKGERLSTGLELMEAGISPALVISRGTKPWPAAEEVCAGARAYEVVCLTAEPDSTKGEGLTISALAQERGWRTLVLVTSDYHLHRANLWFTRCFDDEVVPVAGNTGFSTSRIIHEWLGTAHARLLDRSCNALELANCGRLSAQSRQSSPISGELPSRRHLKTGRCALDRRRPAVLIVTPLHPPSQLVQHDPAAPGPGPPALGDVG